MQGISDRLISLSVSLSLSLSLYVYIYFFFPFLSPGRGEVTRSLLEALGG